MIQEISSVSAAIPATTNHYSDINDNRKMLKALLNATSSEVSDISNSKNEKLDEALGKVPKKKEIDSKINYQTLSEKIQELLEDNSLDVKFDKDKETKIMVLKFIDKETKDTIKQFPEEITIKIAKMVSYLIDHGAIADASV